MLNAFTRCLSMGHDRLLNTGPGIPRADGPVRLPIPVYFLSYEIPIVYRLSDY